MRYKSKQQKGYTIFAVAGIDVVSFGIDFTNAHTNGLLGFAVERHDITEDERYFMKGFKVFKEVFPNPTENLLVSTMEQPVQSFVWDDFTAKPAHDYEYFFYPVRGKPKFLNLQQPLKIKIKTEGLFTNEKHDIFFNRGVASSQEYARRFKESPDKIIDPKLQREAFDWLSRHLKEAFYKFIDRAKKGDMLFGSFYEFHFPEAVSKFKTAIDRGVKVHLIIDCKANGKKDKDGNLNSFPKSDNLAALKKAGITKTHFIQRTANKNAISHNKFLLFQPKDAGDPTEVWTGSTNISEGGIFGQTNVGHWIRDKDLAITYKEYWELLKTNPGIIEGKPETSKANTVFKKAVETITKTVTIKDIETSAKSIIPLFSPRAGTTVLDTYFEFVDEATAEACITLAFGVTQGLKDKLIHHTFRNPIVFMLLEKRDAPASNSKNKDTFVFLNTKQNVYEAFGSFIEDPLYKWTREKNTQALGLNTHVKYIHTKFLLQDPLGDTPVVVTGSANFSLASTNTNDENMVIIKNDKRAADIYFTEFNRLFNHYYFRSVLLDLKTKGRKPDDGSLFLLPDDSWLEKYKPGKLRRKRVDMYAKMKGAITL